MTTLRGVGARPLLPWAIDQRDTAVHRRAGADVEAKPEVARQEERPVDPDLRAGIAQRGLRLDVLPIWKELRPNGGRVTEVETVSDARHQEAIVRRCQRKGRRWAHALDIEAD